MAAPTSITPARLVRGKISIAQVSFTGAETKDLVAAVSGKTVYVLGLLWTHAAAGAITILTAADVILATLNSTDLNYPLTPREGLGNYLNYLQTNSGEALRGTSSSNSKVTVWYVQE